MSVSWPFIQEIQWGGGQPFCSLVNTSCLHSPDLSGYPFRALFSDRSCCNKGIINKTRKALNFKLGDVKSRPWIKLSKIWNIHPDSLMVKSCNGILKKFEITVNVDLSLLQIAMGSKLVIGDKEEWVDYLENLLIFHKITKKKIRTIMKKFVTI